MLSKFTYTKTLGAFDRVKVALFEEPDRTLTAEFYTLTDRGYWRRVPEEAYIRRQKLAAAFAPELDAHDAYPKF